MVIKKDKIVSFLICLTLLFLSFTNVYLFNIGSVQFSVYICFAVLAIATIAIFKNAFPPLETHPGIILIFYILLSSLINFSNSKFTSIVYSLLFIVFYIYTVFYFKKSIAVESYVKITKWILKSFFIILLISQFLVIFDLYTLENAYNRYFQSSGELGILFNHKTGEIRYHSLSSEPSYASIIVLLSFASLYKFETNKRLLLLYGLMTLYMLFFFRSAMAIILMFSWIIIGLKLTKRQFIFLFFLISAGLVLFLFTDIGGNNVDRIRHIVFMFFSFDGNFMENLHQYDSSAFNRLNPFVIYYEQIDLLDYHFYFGNGANASEPYFTSIIFPNPWESVLTFRPAFIPGFFYDYGIFGVFTVFFTLLYTNISKRSYFYMILVTFVLFNSNLNTQLFWFVLSLITLNNFYIKESMQEDNLEMKTIEAT